MLQQFKPSKCTTALRLAVSRIKLLKNKSEGHVKKLRRELALLLHSGHNHAARVRVEYVVMEKKRMGAYDLIQIYCELITARMPMIESQKKCPEDLKEAISSVIFASPRCLDIHELVDVRKHIMAKYGKEFVSAAVELRPDCGVNRLLVEKLSTRAPDGPTKIRILIKIAEEYNVKWKPSLEENDDKLSHDLLAGPSTFEKGSHVEHPQLRVPLVGDEKGPPSLHASCQLKEMRDISKSFNEKHVKPNSSGNRTQEVDYGNLYPENMSAFQKGRHYWEMEFKDAATAAQAAAESAERASVAARAAAELSNREKLTRQISNEWQSSSRGVLRAELSQEYANNTFRRSDFEIHHEQTNVREQHSLVGSHSEHFMNGNDNLVKPSQKVQGEANKKSRRRGSNAYLDSSTSDSEDGVTEQNSVTLAHPLKTGTCFSLKDDPLSKASNSSCSGLGVKSSRVSYVSKDQKVSFKGNWGSSEHGSAEHAPSKPSSEPRSEETVTLSARVQPSSSLNKAMIPDKEETSKRLNCNEDIPSKEKARHVHPKLPDYDTFAAQFLSRKKRLQ